MRVLILAHALDPTATAVAARLTARHGAAAVRHATLPELAMAHWRHQLGADGGITTRIDADGTGLVGDVVFNRLESPAGLPFPGWSVADRAYAHTEWLALLLSWLESLGHRVINRPAPASLTGPADRPWLWRTRAAAAGLPSLPFGVTTSQRRLPLSAAEASAFDEVLVIGDRVFGGDPAVHAACRRLAVAARCDVLALQLAHTGDDPAWRFVAANPQPLIDGGEPLDALVELIESRA